MKILITGGCGQCAPALTALKYEKVFLDRRERIDSLLNENYVQLDLNDLKGFMNVAQGYDAIIHLAARSVIEKDNDAVLKENVQTTHNVLKAANDLGVERVIFASTNHVVGMYEIEHRPRIYELGHRIMLDKHTPPRPDSLYGVSKVFGENLGQFYAENKGPRFYAIRFGAIMDADHDHPYAHAERGVKKAWWQHGSEQYEQSVKRLKALWQSRRDFVQMVDLCLKYKGPAFDLFYGVSDNPRRWLDIEYAKRALGYRPEDNAEHWMSATKLSNTA